MPNPADFESQDEFMKVCVPMVVTEGKDNAAAVGQCMGMWADHMDARKWRIEHAAVKAVGDWELDVNPVPFGSRSTADSDGQWFDAFTDIQERVFQTPLVIYQHGIKRGGRAADEKPNIIGQSIAGTWKKLSDGWHIKVRLDDGKAEAREIMQAAYKREVAVSSDSISHLARLDVGGRLIQYEKNRPGRIAVWPMAGFSLWELGNGNFRPANRQAMALPAMKAIYREAGLPFPDLKDSPGVSNYMSDDMAKRAKVAREQAQKILEKLKR